MGLTLEEYETEQKHKGKIKRVKKEITALEEEIATLKEELIEKKAYLKKLENQ